MARRKASGYIRVVTEDRNSIDEQKRNIENAVFANEYELLNCHMDTGSGGELERDGIQRLIDDARSGKIDAVFVNSIDELSTDIMNTTELMEMLSTLNISVYSIRDKEFLNRPADILGNLSREIYNTLSEMQRNGVDLKQDMALSEKVAEKDPTERLQNKIIQAYLDMQPENRPQV